MVKMIVNRIRLYRKLRFFRYVYLNHFCKNVIRTDRSHILPYKHAVIDLSPECRIYVGGGDLEIGAEAPRDSKTETIVRIRGNGTWTNEGGCRINYGSTLEVLDHALLDTKFFSMNSKSAIITAKNIQLSQDVMIGRNVVIYDSDHHALLDAQGHTRNPDERVQIGKHVWLATNVMVLKGTNIGDHSMIGANSTVHGTIPAETMCHAAGILKQRQQYGDWDRKHPEAEEHK